MKKLFVAFALVMGLGTTATFAASLSSSEVATVASINEHVPVEVKDLPQAVQEALANNYKDLTVKSAAVETSEDGTSTYQVTFTDADGNESVVLFNEKGEVLE